MRCYNETLLNTSGSRFPVCKGLEVAANGKRADATKIFPSRIATLFLPIPPLWVEAFKIKRLFL